MACARAAGGRRCAAPHAAASSVLPSGHAGLRRTNAVDALSAAPSGRATLRAAVASSSSRASAPRRVTQMMFEARRRGLQRRRGAAPRPHPPPRGGGRAVARRRRSRPQPLTRAPPPARAQRFTEKARHRRLHAAPAALRLPRLPSDGGGDSFLPSFLPSQAIKVVMLAQEEARRLGHNFVGTEQIMLGLIGEGTGIAAKARPAPRRTLGPLAARRRRGRIRARRVVAPGWGFGRLFAPSAPAGGCPSLQPSRVRLNVTRLPPCAAPSQVLKAMGINLKEARTEVEKIIGRGSGFVAVEIPFTPRAKRVLELALEEARQLGHSYIGTEHLLLGLLREGEGVAARVLENLGADGAKVRSQVIRMVGESQESVGAAAGGGGGSGGGANKTPTLEEFGTDLTKQAMDGKLDPVIGRVKEVERVTQILGRRTKNNPCLVGEPGVGKSAIAEGLAQKIAASDVPETLEGKRMITLDMGLLVAGTKYRGEFEERLKKLMEEVKADDKIILFIDEVHTLIGAGAAEGAIDAANILKPALARGELQCIGATTIDEYRKHIEKARRAA